MERTAEALAPEGLGREAVELLQRLIRFNTVNPPGNEEQAQLHCQDSDRAVKK